LSAPRLLPRTLEVEIANSAFRSVPTFNGLAALLRADTWPKRSGRACYAALRACLNCLSDQCEPEILSKAFPAAAKDTGVFIQPRRR
jgi:Protein of unknown function (DUF982)